MPHYLENETIMKKFNTCPYCKKTIFGTKTVRNSNMRPQKICPHCLRKIHFHIKSYSKLVFYIVFLSAFLYILPTILGNFIVIHLKYLGNIRWIILFFAFLGVLFFLIVSFFYIGKKCISIKKDNCNQNE